MASRPIVLLSWLLACAPAAGFALSGCDNSLPAFALPPDYDAGVQMGADEDAGTDAEDDQER